jgi:hypothetical protein
MARKKKVENAGTAYDEDAWRNAFAGVLDKAINGQKFEAETTKKESPLEAIDRETLDAYKMLLDRDSVGTVANQAAGETSRFLNMASDRLAEKIGTGDYAYSKPPEGWEEQYTWKDLYVGGDRPILMSSDIGTEHDVRKGIDFAVVQRPDFMARTDLTAPQLAMLQQLQRYNLPLPEELQLPIDAWTSGAFAPVHYAQKQINSLPLIDDLRYVDSYPENAGWAAEVRGFDAPNITFNKLGYDYNDGQGQSGYLGQTGNFVDPAGDGPGWLTSHESAHNLDNYYDWENSSFAGRPSEAFDNVQGFTFDYSPEAERNVFSPENDPWADAVKADMEFVNEDFEKIPSNEMFINGQMWDVPEEEREGSWVFANRVDNRKPYTGLPSQTSYGFRGEVPYSLDGAGNMEVKPNEAFAEAYTMWDFSNRLGYLAYNPETGEKSTYADVYPNRAKFFEQLFQSK